MRVRRVSEPTPTGTIGLVNTFEDIPHLRRRYFYFALIPGMLVFAASVARYIRTTDLDTFVGSAALATTALAWCAWYWRRLRDAARTILIKTRGLTCTHCGYSLVGMDENGACPE